jgi:hypothetical protein
MQKLKKEENEVGVISACARTQISVEKGFIGVGSLMKRGINMQLLIVLKN